MRALTKIEYALLTESIGNSTVRESGDPAEDTAKDLVARGCMVCTDMGALRRYTITPLGRLALRVSRPEQGMELP